MGAIRGIIGSPLTAQYDRAYAADDLADLGPADQEEATRVLCEVMRSTTADATARGSAATWLVRARPAYRDEAAEVIRTLLSAPETTPAERILNAAVLPRLGHAYVAEATRWIRDTVRRDGAPADRVLAAVLLCEIVPGTFEEAGAMLLEVATSPASSAADRSMAASILHPAITA